MFTQVTTSLPGADWRRGGHRAVRSSPPGSLQIITDVIGNPEEERRAAFYHQPWAQEAVGRHIFAKVRLCPMCPLELVGSRVLSHSSLLSPARCSSEGRNWNRCWESA